MKEKGAKERDAEREAQIKELATEPGIPGKKLLPKLVIGCLIFSFILGFGTFFVAHWTTPFFEKLAHDRGYGR